MDSDYRPLFVDATADDILAGLRDLHRHRCHLEHDLTLDILLSPDTTIEVWQEACNLLPWKAVATCMNDLGAVDISLREWKRVLKPSEERKLSDVCELCLVCWYLFTCVVVRPLAGTDKIGVPRPPHVS